MVVAVCNGCKESTDCWNVTRGGTVIVGVRTAGSWPFNDNTPPLTLALLLIDPATSPKLAPPPPIRELSASRLRLAVDAEPRLIVPPLRPKTLKLEPLMVIKAPSTLIVPPRPGGSATRLEPLMVTLLGRLGPLPTGMPPMRIVPPSLAPEVFTVLPMRLMLLPSS